MMRLFDHVWWWFLHATGSDNSSGPEYGFWSGAGSDFGEAAILGGLMQIVHEHNCQVKGCLRLGLHGTDAGHKVCKKHHPTRGDKFTETEIRAAHEAAQ